jgi:hypothetical protein
MDMVITQTTRSAPVHVEHEVHDFVQTVPEVALISDLLTYLASDEEARNKESGLKQE